MLVSGRVCTHCPAMSRFVYMLCVCMCQACRVYACVRLCMYVPMNVFGLVCTHLFSSVRKHLPGCGEKEVDVPYSRTRVYLRGVRKKAGCSPALHDTHTPARTLHNNRREHGDIRHSDGQRRYEQRRPTQTGILRSSWLLQSLQRRAEVCIWGRRIFGRARHDCSHQRLGKL